MRRELGQLRLATGWSTAGGAQPAAARARDRVVGVFRAPVERTFAVLKCWYGYGGRAVAVWSRTPSSCSCSRSPSTCTAPRPARLRADSASTHGRSGTHYRQKAAILPSATPSSRSCPFLAVTGTISGIVRASRPYLDKVPILA